MFRFLPKLTLLANVASLFLPSLAKAEMWNFFCEDQILITPEHGVNIRAETGNKAEFYLDIEKKKVTGDWVTILTFRDYRGLIVEKAIQPGILKRKNMIYRCEETALKHLDKAEKLTTSTLLDCKSDLVAINSELRLNMENGHFVRSSLYGWLLEADPTYYGTAYGSCKRRD